METFAGLRVARIASMVTAPGILDATMADPDERGGAVALESPVGVVAVVLLTLALAGAGYWWQAQLGALLGALGGIVLGMGAQAVLRARAMNRELRERAVPSLQALPPEQAMQVLSAMAGKAGDAPIFSSPLLARLDELRRDAEVNLAGSVALAEDLRAKHPRSPAVERLSAESGHASAVPGSPSNSNSSIFPGNGPDLEATLRGRMFSAR